MGLYAAEGQVIPLDGHPLDRAVELLAARHGITAKEARWRLDRIAAFVRVSDTGWPSCTSWASPRPTGKRRARRSVAWTPRATGCPVSPGGAAHPTPGAHHVSSGGSHLDYPSAADSAHPE